MSQARSLLTYFMTADEFMEWRGDGTNRPYQLVDGEIRAMAPPSQVHGRLQARLVYQLTRELSPRKSACEAVVRPGVRPRPNMNTNVRVPDVVVTCAPGHDKTVDNPTVIAEILSPSNDRETRDAIRAMLTIPSLCDVLVLGSEEATVELLHREPGGDWPIEPQIFGPADTIILPSLGISLSMAELYEGLNLR